VDLGDAAVEAAAVGSAAVADARTVAGVEAAECGAENGIRVSGATGPPSRLQTTMTA
jgi:hypothetical protein